jgi:hypothetical protein
MQDTRNRILIFGSIVAGWLLYSPPDASAGLVVGGTLALSVDDSPLGTSFNQTITLGPGTTALDQGEMTVAQSIVSAGPNSQWLILDFEATNGGLLAGNPNAFWQIQETAQTSAPGTLTYFYEYFSVNGVPTNPIMPFGSGPFLNPQTNPVDPSLSPVYGEALSDPETNLFTFTFASPYSIISSGGMDPSAVNGFVMAQQFMTTSVPEPTSLHLGALSVAIAGGAAFNRRRKQQRAAA